MTYPGLHKLAILFSGGASTALSVVEAKLPNIKIVLAVASNDKAAGIEKLRALGINTIVLSPKQLGESFSSELLKALETNHIDTIAQLGWLARTPTEVINKYKGRILNQHPGPLDPEHVNNDFGGQGMYGSRVHAARLHFAKHTGVHNAWTEATVHQVTKNYDEGEVLGRLRVDIPEQILKADISSPSKLKEQAQNLQNIVIAYEHKLVVETLAKLAAGSLTTLKRGEALISTEELTQLEHSKQAAIEAYQIQSQSSCIINHRA